MVRYRGLADYIERRCEDVGTTPHSLSETLGYASSYINNIISGQFRPSTKRAREIARYFGDDPGIILELAGYSEPLEESEETAELVRMFQTLPSRLKEEALNFVQYLKHKQDRKH